MSMSIIAVGRMKEKPYRAMADEYLKRLSRYGKFEEIELPDLPEPQNSSPAIEEQIKQKEGYELQLRIVSEAIQVTPVDAIHEAWPAVRVIRVDDRDVLVKVEEGGVS